MELSREEQFLMKEYENAADLTFHIDTLRNSLTGFFLTLSGLAAGALAFLLKGDVRLDLGFPLTGVVGALLTFLGFLGLAAVRVLSRLRSVQLQYFRIMNNIREHFLGAKPALWNVVEVSRCTLPSPSRGSGTYAWLSMIMFVTALLFASSVYLYLARVFCLMSPVCSLMVSTATFAVLLVAQDQWYLHGAKARPRETYSERVAAARE